MKIGEKLKMLRTLNGFTQDEVAKRLNIERRSYANLENNCTKLDLMRMSQIAKIYGMDTSELLNFEDTSTIAKLLQKDHEIINKGNDKNEKNLNREMYVNDIKSLLSTFNCERKVFLDIIIELRNQLKKNHNFMEIKLP